MGKSGSHKGKGRGSGSSSSRDHRGGAANVAGKGKGDGKSSSKGGAFGNEYVQIGDIKESDIQLAEDSQAMILKLVASFMQARGDALPSGEKRRKGGGGGKDLSTKEDGDSDDDDDPEAQRRRAKDAKKQEERVMRRLQRQLLNDDRKAANEAGDPVAGEAAVAMTSERLKKVPQGSEVRLLLCNEEKRNERPRGPITFARGGLEAVEEVIRVAKAKLDVKGGSKKTFWVYVNGGATGNDKHNKHKAPLLDTCSLVNDDLVILSCKELPNLKKKKKEEDSAAASASASSAIAVSVAEAQRNDINEDDDAGMNRDDDDDKTGCGGSGGAPPESPAASPFEEDLDAVKEAYRSRHGRHHTIVERSQEQIKEETKNLSEALETWESAEHLKSMRKARGALPAWQSRESLMEALRHSQVVVIVGETGSGKTTQCPHFILEDYIRRDRGGECTIVCTQPRRIAAIGVAERVSQERGENAGGTVGYAVRLDAKSSNRTRLLFCTTGVLLQQLNVDKELKHVSHVVIDEAHERNIQTDFLLTILRDLLPRRPELKLVLMSATLQEALFVKYFQRILGGAVEVPVVRIPGRTHPVDIRFLDDVKKVLAGRPLPRAAGAAAAASASASADDDDESDAAASASVSASASASGIATTGDLDKEDSDLQNWIKENLGSDFISTANKRLISPTLRGNPDFRLLADLVALVLKGNHGYDGREDGDAEPGAILVFLSGHEDIERAISALRSHKGIGDKAWLVPLHGSLSTQSQRMAFQRPRAGQRKVVLATNIAETSITIDDVTHVIDLGHVKESRYDPNCRMEILATCYVSQAAAKQRAGRAGRVRPGVCWRLYSEDFFSGQLPESTLCEMRRTSLEELVLQLRLLDLNSHPKEVLRKAPEPPSSASIDSALQGLVEIGALSSEATGLKLTALGYHLVHMPLDVRTAKMLLYGSLLGCLGPALTVAACLSEKSPFLRGFNQQREEELRSARQEEFGHLRSDHLAVIQAFDSWLEAKHHGKAQTYCDRFGLAQNTLESMRKLRERYTQHLQDIGFAPKNYLRWSERTRGDDAETSWNPDANSKELVLVRCVLCAGLYPNVAQVQRTSNGKGTGTTSMLISSSDLTRCTVHPRSLNYKGINDMQANHGWLVYHSKVKTTQVFLHDSTLIGPMPLLLFGGGDLELHRNRKTLVLDSKLRFDVGKQEQTAVLLKLLRKEAHRLLLLKIKAPDEDISRKAEPLLEAVVKLLRMESGGLRKNR